MWKSFKLGIDHFRRHKRGRNLSKYPDIILTPETGKPEYPDFWDPDFWDFSSFVPLISEHHVFITVFECMKSWSGRSQDLRLWGIFCQDCQDMRGKNDENISKVRIFWAPVSGVRIMSGYFDKFLPLPCLRKWSIPNLTDFYIGWRSNVYEINWVLSCFISWVSFRCLLGYWVPPVFGVPNEFPSFKGNKQENHPSP